MTQVQSNSKAIELQSTGGWVYLATTVEGVKVTLKDITTDIDENKTEVLASYEGVQLYTKVDAKGKNKNGLRYFVLPSDYQRQASKASGIKRNAIVDTLVARGMTQEVAQATYEQMQVAMKTAALKK